MPKDWLKAWWYYDIEKAYLLSLLQMTNGWSLVKFLMKNIMDSCHVDRQQVNGFLKNCKLFIYKTLCSRTVLDFNCHFCQTIHNGRPLSNIFSFLRKNWKNLSRTWGIIADILVKIGFYEETLLQTSCLLKNH